MTPSWTSAALLAMAALGALDALYFTLVADRVVRPDTPWLPAFCRMDDATCARVVDAREARALGVPNSLLGLGWYAVLAGAASWGLATGALPVCPFLLAGAVAAALLSAWLAWALLARLRVRCPLCFAAHAINGAALVLLLLACA
ncbi:MAG TPA: vitamin K epoxide reductase family protein [Candidatus Thermoplasmatota archaeon]|jgi:uncharacterized membrane protein|nr:vitamin K epoxide reductase family protein [Candidatus Thermoplasmatota archaeon]